MVVPVYCFVQRRPFFSHSTPIHSILYFPDRIFRLLGRTPRRLRRSRQGNRSWEASSSRPQVVPHYTSPAILQSKWEAGEWEEASQPVLGWALYWQVARQRRLGPWWNPAVQWASQVGGIVISPVLFSYTLETYFRHSHHPPATAYAIVNNKHSIEVSTIEPEIQVPYHHRKS